MSAQATAHNQPDLALVELIERTWDDEAHREVIAVRMPSFTAIGPRYRIVGHSDGRATGCDCTAGQFGKPCKHLAAFALAVSEVERRHYDDYPTEGLLRLLAYYDHQLAELNDDQRLRRNGVAAQLTARGVDFRTGRTLAERNRVIARGEAAKAELFG